MYATRTEVMVVAGKTLAWEAWWTRLIEMAKAQQGFQAQCRGLRSRSICVFSLRDARQRRSRSPRPGARWSSSLRWQCVDRWRAGEGP